MSFLPRYTCLALTLMALTACGDDEKQPPLLPLVDANDTSIASPILARVPLTLDESSTNCVDIQDSNHAVGTHATLNLCNGGDNQGFTYTNNHLRVFLQKCLTVENNANASGAKVVIDWCDPNNLNQTWTRNGRAYEWNNSGKCLDLPGNSVIGGAQLQIWACNSTNAQKWSDASDTSDANIVIVPPAPPPQPTPKLQFLPTVKGDCPPLKTGMQTFNGQQVQLWAANAQQPNSSLVLYWHATGGNSGEAGWGFGTNQINDVVAKGGMVASFNSSTGTGANLNGNRVWFGDDFYTADQVVACAIRDLHIDPRRIYVTGASAGGLATTWMSYARSGYIAATAPLSGGMLSQTYGMWGDPTNSMQDPNNVPVAMVTHGGKGIDVYQPTHFDFAIASSLYERNIAEKGGMSIDCNTGGGHVAGPPTIGPFVWQFFQDHPFQQTPELYQGKVPSNFPSYCQMGPITY